ncbi:MAG: hypothetical protein RR415_11670 [Ruthenibacterium sp.]
MADKYTLERDGQLDFYSRVLPRVSPVLSIEHILSNNNDGVLNGNLLEFKLSVSDLNAVLFQCIKYLSAMRIKGIPIPANILIVDLNAAILWLYHSEDYLASIERPYTGSASKDNSGFIGAAASETLHYETNASHTTRLIELLKEKRYTKTHIDENCIVGWAEHFYRCMPTARKEDFLGDDTGKHKKIGEIRRPTIFADYLIPYTGKTNIKFSYLMDKLNDFLLKKNLGAFYTASLYAEKAVELVRQAIARVPVGNDYIILDRCAGTGNLENCMTDEELSHTIVSTVEYYEYKILQELLGFRVRAIVPPIEGSETFCAGLVSGADALSKEYIDNPIIRQYIDNPKMTIILFENPPYAETTSAEHQRHGAGAKSSAIWKTSYVVTEMKADIKGKVKGSPSNDMGNAFIWSAFKYYLRQPTDSYIVFSPVKYWKAQHLVKKQFLGGYAFNRRHFHTSIDACIMCALWANIDDTTTNSLMLTGYDIVDGKLLKYPEQLPVKLLNKTFSEVYYDKRPFTDTYDGIAAALNGLEFAEDSRIRIRKTYNENIVCYMVANGSNFDNPDINTTLLRAGQYNGNGFYVRRDNYLEKLPLFVTGRYITYNRNWTERARIMKSADGASAFARDVANGTLKQFLLKCLLFTCLEMQNHVRTFTGSDGRFYRNELCFDTTNGETFATRDIQELKLNNTEKALLEQWNTILNYAKQVRPNERGNGYNSVFTYGVYQVYAELDTAYKDDVTGKTVYDNIELHTALNGLKELVKAYYTTEIVPVLFQYEFLK